MWKSSHESVNIILSPSTCAFMRQRNVWHRVPLIVQKFMLHMSSLSPKLVRSTSHRSNQYGGISLLKFFFLLHSINMISRRVIMILLVVDMKSQKKGWASFKKMMMMAGPHKSGREKGRLLIFWFSSIFLLLLSCFLAGLYGVFDGFFDAKVDWENDISM